MSSANVHAPEHYQSINSLCPFSFITSKMIPLKTNILLADDDNDDCHIFKDALEELELASQLTTVADGEQLMQLLTKNSGEFFDVLFLDLNMPRKNGFACLEEIKRSPQLKSLPVIILSTSYDQSIAYKLYQNGAQHYICKPADFSELKKVIEHALKLILKGETSQPSKEKFLLNCQKSILM